MQAKPGHKFPLTLRHLKDSARNRGMVGCKRILNPNEFKQYTRITVNVEGVTEAQLLHNGNAALMKYDVVAACPGTLPAFVHLCKQAEIDIIRLDFSRRLPFNLDQKHVLSVCLV
jgi:RNase P/RNase MRP subunit p30